jgi:benzoate-CoA ligase
MKASKILPAEFNAASHFVDRNVNLGRGNSPAFSWDDRTLTYGELQELVNRAGNALAEIGVGRAQRVLLLCLDAAEFVGAFWGAIKLGAVPVPVNTLLRESEYLFFLEHTGARAAVVSAPLLGKLEPVLPRARALEHLLVAGGASSPLSWEERLDRASPRLEAAPTSRDDPAFWLYSSGSTGTPKGAVHLQHDMVVCAETYAKGVLGIRESDRCFSAAKLFFAYGLGNANYFPLAVGAESVLYAPRPTPEALFEVITRRRPTLFFAVPTIYAAMLAVKEAERKYDLSSVRLCVSAGESLPAEIGVRWQERFGVEILDGIGTTEVLHIFLSNRPGAVRPGSTGTVVPGYEAVLVDEVGRPVPRGEIGNLRVKGDSIMAGYFDDEARTKDTLHGEWIHTGDKFRQDEEGLYWHCGRSDDMLKVNGIWVSPVEVEATLIGHPAVLEAAVVGKEDADGLVKPKAFVVLKERARAGAAIAEELRALVKERIASYKCPRWIEFLEELPKTATGKIQRFKLRG